MALGIIEPATSEANLIPAYRPVVYRVSLGIIEAVEPRAGFIEAIEATVFWNGTEVATLRKSWFSKLEVVAGSWEYEFDIDVQRIAQHNLLPKTNVKSGTFGDINESREGDNPADAYGEIDIEVDVYYRDTDNLLKVLSGGAFPADYAVNVVPFAMEQKLYQILWGDDRYVYQIANDVIRELTNQPIAGVPISAGESGWLSCIVQDIDAYRVRFYNDSGEVTSAVKIKDLGAAGSGIKVATIGSGAKQIDTLTSEVGWDYDLSDAYINSGNYTYYIIDFGDWGGGSTFTSKSRGVRYNVVQRNENKQMRVHFLNRLGGADAYTFDCKRQRGVEVSSEQGRKTLGWTTGVVGGEHDREGMGAFRYNIKSGVAFELETKLIDYETALWLEELLDSPEVYIERLQESPMLEGTLERVVIEDTNGTLTDDWDEGVGIPLKLTIRLANDVIRQRY